RQPGTGVDELAPPRPGNMTARTPHEGPVGLRQSGDFGELLQNPFGGSPVGLIVILALEQVVVNPRDSRLVRGEGNLQTSGLESVPQFVQIRRDNGVRMQPGQLASGDIPSAVADLLVP